VEIFLLVYFLLFVSVLFINMFAWYRFKIAHWCWECSSVVEYLLVYGIPLVLSSAIPKKERKEKGKQRIKIACVIKDF
jgi:hypothetical protein